MSVLPRQLVPVVLGPRDKGQSQKLSVPGTLIRAENVVMRTTNLYEKRPGSQTLATLSSAAGAELATREGELVAHDGTNLYTFSEAAQSFTSVGNAKQLLLETATVMANQEDLHSPDVARAGGYLFFVYERYNASSPTNPLVYYTVLDEETGQVVVADTQVASQASSPKVVAVGTNVVIFYHNTTTSRVNARRIQTSAPGTMGAVTVVDNSASSQYFDVQARGSTIDVVIRMSTTAIKFLLWDPSAMTAGANTTYTHTTLTSAAIAWVNYGGANGNVYALHIDNTGATSTNVLLLTVPTGFGTVPTGTSLYAVGSGNAKQITGWVSGTTLYALWQEEPATSTDVHRRLITKATHTLGGATSTAVLTRSVGLASRAFAIGSTYYFLATHENTLQPTFFLLDESGNVTARILSQLGGGLNDRQSQLATPTVLASGTRWVIPVRRLATATRGMIEAVYLDSDTATLGPMKDVGDVLMIPGANPRMYDGARVVEVGFHLYPETTSTSVSGAGGNMATGTYYYRVTYAWEDAQGRIYRSSPSATGQAFTTSTATSQVTVTVPCLRVTAKTVVKPRIELWITQVNGGTAAPLYYVGAVANDETADTATITNTTAINGTTEILYTQGDNSVVENFPPPPALAFEVHGGRLWAIGMEDRREVWFSKTLQTDDGVAFSDEFTQRFDDTPGGVTALATLNDKLGVFKETSVFMMWGDGPDDTGEGVFATPQRTASAVGTDAPRSLCTTNLGTFFRASDSSGLWLLDWAGATTYLGSPVEDLNSLAIKGAVVVPHEQHVRFATTAETLVYDLVHQRWYTWTGQNAAGGCTYYQGAWCYMTSAGVVRRESTSVYQDGSTDIAVAFETGDMPLAGLSGFGRLYEVQIIGTWYGAHTLATRLTFDYDARTSDDTFDATTSPTAYHLEIPVPLEYQRATAVRVRLVETPGSPVTRGFGLEAISLLVGIRQGRARLPAGQKL